VRGEAGPADEALVIDEETGGNRAVEEGSRGSESRQNSYGKVAIISMACGSDAESGIGLTPLRCKSPRSLRNRCLNFDAVWDLVALRGAVRTSSGSRQRPQHAETRVEPSGDDADTRSVRGSKCARRVFVPRVWGGTSVKDGASRPAEAGPENFEVADGESERRAVLIQYSRSALLASITPDNQWTGADGSGSTERVPPHPSWDQCRWPQGATEGRRS
jgi:hypothetical protein